MNSDRCTKLISETLNLVGQARDARQGPWECAYIAPLTSLNRMKERILTREAREAAQAKGPA